MKNASPFEFMIRYLKKEKILIDFEEYKFQTETHPDYPSLLSFSESLSFFNIDNVATQVPKDQIDLLPDNFIALLDAENGSQYLTFVSREGDGFNYFYDGTMHYLDKEPFTKKWTGIILIAEKTEDTQTSETKSKIPFGVLLPVLVIPALVAVFMLSNNWAFTSFFFFTFLGIFLAVEALKQEFGMTKTLTSGVCTVSSATDCESVITSEKAKFLGVIGLSDVSISFFSAQLLNVTLIGTGVLAGYFAQLSLLSLLIAIPVTLYSFYYQYRIAKKWCPICLGIAGTLYVQALFLFLAGTPVSIPVQATAISVFVAVNLASLVVWLGLKPYIKEYFDLKSANMAAVRFKRNYPLFKNTLISSKQMEYHTLESSLALGNPDAPLKLSMVTNPFCGYCKGAHESVHKILKRYGKSIRINIRFSVDPENADENSLGIHQRFVEIYRDEGQEGLLKAMDAWFGNRDIDQWFSIYGKPDATNAEGVNNLLKIQRDQNFANELMFTPAFIIGEHLYPSVYNHSDLINFIGEMEEDEDILMGELESEVTQG